MLSLSPLVKIYLASAPIDMRKGIDGLAGLVESVLDQAPESGHLFVFRNRKNNRIKILVWDDGGFWLHLKRLEKGRFQFPEATEASVQVRAAELALLLGGIDWRGARRLPRWNPEIRSPSGLAA